MIPKGRILCTEDDPDTRDLLILMLSAAGYDATCTKNAEDALLRVQTESFDLFLLDNWLPDTSGLELCKQIRLVDPDTPILFYSGAGYATDKERAVASGAQGYLVKPVMPDELVAEVSRLVEKRYEGSERSA